MESQGARQKILQKIKQALKDPVPVPFPDQVADTPIFIPTEKEMAIEFAQKFTELLGKFVYCADEQELINQLNALIITKGWNKIYSKETAWLTSLRPLQFDPITTEDLADCDAAITLCTHLVARTGTIVLSSKESSGRTASVYAPIHICIAYADQLVYDMTDSLVKFKDNIDIFLPMWFDNQENILRTIHSIILLKNYLKSKNIDFIMFEGLGSILDEYYPSSNYNINDESILLKDEFKLKLFEDIEFFKKYGDMRTYMRKSDLVTDSEFGHPPPKYAKWWADEIYIYLKENYENNSNR